MADADHSKGKTRATDASPVAGVATNVPPVESVAATANGVNIPSASIAYTPEDMESQRASPIEVDHYLTQEENWGAVKREMALEERTATLTLQERNRAFQLQALPSISSQGFLPPNFVRRK